MFTVQVQDLAPHKTGTDDRVWGGGLGELVQRRGLVRGGDIFP